MEDMIVKLVVALEHPAAELRPNGRAHWATRAREVKRARRIAKLKALASLKCERPADGAVVRYSIAWFFKGAMPDADNCLASCKAYLDGVADALKVDDRVMECTGIKRVRDKFAAKTVIIHVTW